MRSKTLEVCIFLTLASLWNLKTRRRKFLRWGGKRELVLSHQAIREMKTCNLCVQRITNSTETQSRNNLRHGTRKTYLVFSSGQYSVFNALCNIINHPRFKWQSIRLEFILHFNSLNTGKTLVTLCSFLCITRLPCLTWIWFTDFVLVKLTQFAFDQARTCARETANSVHARSVVTACFCGKQMGTDWINRLKMSSISSKLFSLEVQYGSSRIDPVLLQEES